MLPGFRSQGVAGAGECGRLRPWIKVGESGNDLRKDRRQEEFVSDGER